MSHFTHRRISILGGLGFAALLALLVAVNDIGAQEKKAGLVIGTFDPQQVAEQTGIQQRMMKAMEGLQQRAETAQQTGDQQAMMAIQQEAMQIQEQIAGDFEKEMTDAMPKVAAKAGVHAIVMEVSYSSDEVEVKDVTAQLLAELARGGAAAPAAAPGLTLQ